MDEKERYEAGLGVRKEVLGEAHVERSLTNRNSFNADFQDLITRYAWGEIWDRPGLGRRERSIATLSALVTLRAEDELALHVRAALRNGLTPTEIKETLLHTAVYAGVPAARTAFAIAQGVIAEADG